MSAESKKLTPRSSAACTTRALAASSSRRPKLLQPRPATVTRMSESPSARISMPCSSQAETVDRRRTAYARSRGAGRRVDGVAVETRGRLDVGALYEGHRLRVYRAIRGIVFDPAVAEDLTQEAFERAWRARDSFRGQ